MKRVCFVAIVMAALAAPAQADQTWFHSPSGNIQCELDFDVGPGLPNQAYCQTFEPARSVSLRPNGKLKHCKGGRCLGNGPEDSIRLDYGESVRQGVFRCTSRENGVACRIGKHGKGFRISKAGVKRLR